MEGVIYVEEVLQRNREVQAWFAKCREKRQREEVLDIVRGYWSADDRQQYVRDNQWAFDLYKVYKRRAEEIRSEDRLIVDAAKGEWIKVRMEPIRQRYLLVDNYELV